MSLIGTVLVWLAVVVGFLIFLACAFVVLLKWFSDRHWPPEDEGA